MPTQQSTIDFLLDQLSSLSNVRVKKMFGEYALYCDEKVVALVCDDQIFVKITGPGKNHAKGRYVEGCAYPGAKVSMNGTDEIDDSEFLCTLMRLTADALPLPKPKKLKK